MKRFAPLCLLLMALYLQSIAITNCKITANSSYSNPVCTAHNGSIAISPGSGTAPYSYHWNTVGSTSALHSLAAGNYAVTVTDAQGCTAAQTFTLVTTSRTMILNATAVSDTCASGRGRVTVVVQGNGNAPLRYLWSNNGTSATITGLSARYYSVVVSDSNGCSATAGASVSNIGTAIAVTGAVTQPQCYGTKGSINTSATGGAGGAFSYLWSNAATGNIITALTPGNYIVTVNGQHGCSASHTFTITNPDSIQLQYTVANLKCDLAQGGSLTNASITGANYPWTALWTGPNSYTAHSVSINGLIKGNYHLTFTDAHNCSTTRSYFVDSLGSMNVVYSVSNIQCGGNTGAINYVSLSPYSQLATYRWTGGNNFSSTSQSIANLAAGNYTVNVSENFGCSAVRNYNVTQGFDVGVSAIKNYNDPTPGRWFMFHPIAGDMSQLTGNHCAAGISGQVQFSFTGQAHYAGVTPGALHPDIVRGDTLIWNIADFGRLRTDSSFFILFNTDSSANLFSQVCATVTVTPLVGDYNPTNNTMEYCLSVVRPSDPNEMVVSPEGNIDTMQKWLTYTVHFQNTGSAPAQHVFILDSLDSHLDASTLKVLGSSHQVQSLVSGNVVKFDFEDIDLPDSASNQAGSHGTVQYTIRLLDNLASGTEIKANANIYFDFNLPVATNYTLNTITPGISTSVNEVQKGAGGLIFYPNPAHDIVFVKADNDALGGRIEITDALGRKCVSTSIVDNIFNLPINHLARGVYVISILKPSGFSFAKKLTVE